jgi:phosphoribosylformimino-5-aminoimidazole carboxamide ribotide isomerase
MRIIPVIDLLDGVVVHAVRGQRKHYHPLRSVLCDCAEPLAVGVALEACGFGDLYIADLDAIMKQGSNAAVVSRIAEETDLKVMLDSGIATFKQADEAFQSKASKIIVGTETLTDLSFLKEAVECFGADKVVVSLDLKEGKVLSKVESLRTMSAQDAACSLQGQGMQELIVLDLARVGSGEGVDFSLLKKLLETLRIEVLVGGGVRDIQDLKTLEELGVHGVLLATALHTGKISPEMLRSSSLIV